MSNQIEVQALRVGMYVHLDVGWMSHPFATSNFRISDSTQIDTIRQLGLKQVRWSPEKSLLAPAAATTPPAQADTAPAVAPPFATNPIEVRKQQLKGQHESTQRCEVQYLEAGNELTKLTEQLASQPQAALTQCSSLTAALLDKMLVEGDVCVRMLTASAGDRASAHALNVAVIAMLMGRMMGMPRDELQALGEGALLHDIGKLELGERWRYGDEGFTPADVERYRDHVARGVALGQRMGLSNAALLVLAQHHEHADGSGFPKHLTMDRLTLASRIVAMVNRYDNLCNPAVLTRALTPHEALQQLFTQCQSQFDVGMLNAFIRMMGVYPAGSVVQLTDERYAMVVSVNAARPLKPRVLVHDRGVPREEALYVDLESQPGLGIRRSITLARLPSEPMEYLAPRPRVAYFFEPQTSAEVELV